VLPAPGTHRPAQGGDRRPARIEEEILPFARRLELLETIPGVGRTTAEIIVAETGADMARFRTAGHLASWAGVCPGHHESAGKHKSGSRRHGNRWLGAALGTAAMAASRTRETTCLGARYHRLVPRLGKKKALVAIPSARPAPRRRIRTGPRPLRTPRRRTIRPLKRAPRRRRDPLAPGWPLDQDSLIH
jgi:transposase